MSVAKHDAMQKLNPLSFLFFALTILTLASCATEPQTTTATTTTTTTTTNDTSRSPLDRNNGNGLASFMH